MDPNHQKNIRRLKVGPGKAGDKWRDMGPLQVGLTPCTTGRGLPGWGPNLAGRIWIRILADHPKKPNFFVYFFDFQGHTVSTCGKPNKSPRAEFLKKKNGQHHRSCYVLPSKKHFKQKKQATITSPHLSHKAPHLKKMFVKLDPSSPSRSEN